MLFKVTGGRTLDDVLGHISREHDLYTITAGSDGHHHLTRTGHWDPARHTLGPYRPVEPLKSLFFPPREYLGPIYGTRPASSDRKRMVIGVKNCDLASLRIHDHVFRDTEPGDPGYREARDRTLLIAADCTGCRETCFCTVVGDNPYPAEGFDVNITVTPKGAVLESGTARGETLLREAEHLLAPADEALLGARNEQRLNMVKRVTEQSARLGLRPELDFREAVRSARDSNLWREEADRCVECGACNMICCTCHCFLLADGVTPDGQTGRVKQWDSCLFTNFARVAGGGNPRARRAARLRNRFDKKFVFFPQTMGRYACDGCGRCTEACTAGIDIRAVLKRAVDETPSLSAAASGN